jgi:hypothetical protein
MTRNRPIAMSHSRIIHSAAQFDDDAIWRVIEPVFRAGETYPLPRDISRDDAFAYDVVDPSPGLGDGGEQSVPAFGPHFSQRSTACLSYGLGARVRTHRS